ncbi:unnamed protein product [Cylicocyclus nassatus]|uniref:Uncharacterized protein n=1 Tax=Cylicocyclus nassatus TaxID=53992 RepID=A0AA36DKQ1_CYLNA|nr:unnamed protein product [Cylicocyclus nassatus]
MENFFKLYHVLDTTFESVFSFGCGSDEEKFLSCYANDKLANALHSLIEGTGSVPWLKDTQSDGLRFGKRRLCMPGPFDEALAKIQMENLLGEEEGKITRRVVAVNDMISKVIENVKDWYKANATKKSETPIPGICKNLEEKIAKNLTHKIEDNTPSASEDWHSNMFVIVSKKERKAIAYVGTLGSFFGSGIKSEKFGIYFNNILDHVKEGATFNRLLPTIVFNDKEISYAFASNGGSPSQTLSLPRTLSMVMLERFFNVRLHEGVTYPLAFPSPARPKLVLKDRVPYVEHLHKHFEVEKTGRIPDEVVAAETTGGKLSAFYADNFKGRKYTPRGV